MTTFAPLPGLGSKALPKLPGLAPVPALDLGGVVKRAKSLTQTAGTTEPAAPTAKQIQQRAVPRVSVAELNATDLDTLRERFLSSRRDDRPAWVKVLDLIDAPRNFVAGTIWPEIEREKRLGGETGAGGAGKVFFSDALRKMGVENKVVRGLVGLVGDVLTDPLMLVGPLGGIAKVTTTGGRVVALTPRFGKALKVASEGREAGSAASKLLEAAGTVKDFKAAKQAVLGAPEASKTMLGRAVQRVGKLTGSEGTRKGGVLSEALDYQSIADTPAARAAGIVTPLAERAIKDPLSEVANEVVRQFGLGTSPGIRVGRDAAGKWGIEFARSGPGRIVDATSTLLHIPGTEIGLHVPGFTGQGKAAIRNLAFAAGVNRVGQTLPAWDPLVRMRAATVELARHADEGKAVGTEEKALQAEFADITKRTPQPGLFGEVPGPDPHALAADRLSQIATEREARKQTTLALANEIKTLANPEKPWPMPANATLGEIYALKRERDAMEAMADLVIARHQKAFTDVSQRTAIKADIVKNQTLAMAQIDRLHALREDNLPGFLGVDPTVAEPVINADPEVVRQVSFAAKPLIDQYEAARNELIAAQRGGGLTREQRLAGRTMADLQADVQRTRDTLYQVTEPLRGKSPATPELPGMVAKLGERATVWHHGSHGDFDVIRPSGNKTLEQKSRGFDGMGVWLSGSEESARMYGPKVSHWQVKPNNPLELVGGGFRPWDLLADKSVLGEFLSGVDVAEVMNHGPRRRAILDKLYHVTPQMIAQGKVPLNTNGQTYAEAIAESLRAKGHDAVVWRDSKLDLPKDAKQGHDVMLLLDESLATKESGRPALSTMGTGPAIPMQTIEQFREGIKAHKLAALDAPKRALMELSDADIVRMNEEIDILHKQAEAAKAAAMVLQRAPVSFMEGDDLALVELTKMFLGTSEANVGLSTMAPLRSAAEAVAPHDGGVALSLIDRTDRLIRKHLGLKSGEAFSAARRSYQATKNAERAQKAAYAAHLGAVTKMAVDAGLDKSEVPALLNLVFAKMTELNAPKSGLYTTKFGTKEPAEWLQLLQDAMASGVLNEKIRPGLAKQVAEYAAKNVDLIKTVGEQAVEHGTLAAEQLRPGYLPNVATGQAEELIRRQKLQALEATGPVGKARAAGLESFQKARTHDQARFKSVATGKEERIFEADRWAQTLSDSDIAQIENPDEQNAVRSLRDLLDEYDAMPNRPPMVPTDPWEMNKLLKDGRFAPLLGTSEIPTGFMETNVATVLAAMTGQHESALARQFWDEYQKLTTLFVPTSVMKKLQDVGASVHIGGGAFGKVVKLDSKRNGIRVGTDVFRPVDSPLRSNTANPMIADIGQKNLGKLHHEVVADAIEKVAGLFQDSQSTGEFWKGVDTLTRFWKTVTLMHPSWFVFNVIGDGINLWADDPQFMVNAPKDAPQILKLIYHANDPEFVKKLNIQTGLDDFKTGTDLLDMAGQAGLTGHYMTTDVPTYMVRNSMLTLQSRLDQGSVAAYGRSFKPTELKADYLQALAHFTAAGDTAFKAGFHSGKLVMSDRLARGLIEPWFRVNQRTQEAMRLLAYLSHRRQGVDHAQAVARVLRAGIDYGDISKLDVTMRRVMPFWMWVRGNSGYQAKKFLERPIYAGSLPLLQNALEEAIDGEKRIPTMMRPNWMRQQLALQLGTDPESRIAFTVGTALPQEQLIAMLSPLVGWDGAQQFLNYFASSINPVARAPIEAGIGREFFSDRTIGGDAMLSDMSLGQHAANQIRPLREIPKLIDTFGEQGAGAGIARALVGGRAQPMSDSRIKSSRLREFKDEEERLRRTIRKSQDQGADSAKARVRLMLLYRDMVSAGFDADVPKWARGQLQQLQPQG